MAEPAEDLAPSSPPPPERPSSGAALAAVVGLVALIAWLYVPVLDHPFSAFDDQTYLVENRGLDAGLGREGVAWAFETRIDGNRIPLTWISFLADQELHGLSARGTHATNVVLHALATVLLFVALLRMTASLGASAFVGAIFAAHPLHVESVAWAIERKDVLSGALFAAALVAHASYAARPGVLRYLGVALLFALGLASKPMLVTLPCVLLLLDAWPLGRLGSAAGVRRAVLEKLPLLALSAASSLLTVRSQGDAGAFDGVEASLPWRVANAVVSYGAYLRKTVWPDDLAVIYPHLGEAIPMASVVAGAAVVVVLSAVAALQWRRRPWLGVGWLWYLGMLVPVIGVLQVGTQALADRYMYLPLAGLLVAVAWTGSEVARRGGAARAGVSALAVAALVASTVAARAQLGHWRDDIALYERALAVTDRNARAHNGLALGLLAEDRDDEARPHVEAALEIDPGFTAAHVNRGVLLLRAGEPEAAVESLRHGLTFPAERRVSVHARLGIAYLAADDPRAALQQARHGLAITQDAAVLHAVAGMAQVRLGSDDLGLMALQRADAMGYDGASVQATLGDVLSRRGRTAEAVDRYRRALAARPGDAAVANNLAWILATDPELRDPAEAVRLAETAAELAPGDASVLDTLAVAYHAAGRLDAARATAARAAATARAAGNDALAESIEASSRDW